MCKLTGVVGFCAIVVGVSPVTASEQQHSYRVEHSVYGEIGIYRDNVRVNGSDTAIETEVDIRISVFGIILYRQHASRVERWTDGRLIYFHGITLENGKTTQIDGRAEADRFIVNSPAGRTAAPAQIQVANPGSAGTLSGNMILMPDTGLVTNMSVSGGEETSLTIDGKAKQAKLYQIKTGIGIRYGVWVDDYGTPLKFNIRDGPTIITFTLVRQ
jgi:hypothetical protein